MIEIPPDGNCGYHAFIGAAKLVNLLGNGPVLSHAQLRKVVYDEVEANYEDYVGNGKKDDNQLNVVKIIMDRKGGQVTLSGISSWQKT